MSDKSRLTKVIVVRVSEDESKRIDSAILFTGETRSAFTRRVLLEATKRTNY